MTMLKIPERPLRIETVAEISYRLVDHAWPFASERAAEIDAHWQDRVRHNHHLYDGRVLLMHHSEISDNGEARRLGGHCFVAAYKAFIAWRDFGFPDRAIANVFAMAALRSADGAFLLGEMAATTASPGRVYFPAGTPEPSDVKAGAIDFESNVLRELEEETGLGARDILREPGWTVVFNGSYIACMKTLRSLLSAAELIARVDAFLAKEQDPELTRLKPVFSANDLEPERMPAFIPGYLHHVWNAER